MAQGLECTAVLLTVLGLTGLFWWLLGRLLRPIPGGPCFILLPGRGGGEGLEQAVRGFLWLRGLGLLTAPILIADAGLAPQGRELALRLCARWPEVILWPLSDLQGYLEYL